jgi:DNA-binding IclR family transcriptional regulator
MTGPAKRGAARAARDQGGVQSVAIAARILKALAAHGGVLPLKAIAAATAMPRAKVHRYLTSLRSAGLIVQDAVSGAYQIGPAAVTIGLVGLGRMSPVRQLQEALTRLREHVNETVTAAIWGERGPTIVAIEESDHLVTMNIRIGTVLPLLTTAIGRLFLAYLPPSMTAPLVAAERRSNPDAPAEDEIAALIQEIRARRLARAHSALLPGVDAVAAPVFDHRDKLVGVVCAVGRSGVMNMRWDGPVVTSLTAAAAELSRQLGHLGDGPGTDDSASAVRGLGMSVGRARRTLRAKTPKALT